MSDEISVDRSIFEEHTKLINQLEIELREVAQRVKSDLGDGENSLGNVKRNLNAAGKGVQSLGHDLEALSERLNAEMTKISLVDETQQKQLDALNYDVQGDKDYVKPIRLLLRQLKDSEEVIQKKLDELVYVVNGDDIQRPLREICTEFLNDKVFRSGINWVIQGGTSLLIIGAGWFMSSQIYDRFQRMETQLEKTKEMVTEMNSSLKAIKQQGDRNQEEIDRLRK